MDRERRKWARSIENSCGGGIALVLIAAAFFLAVFSMLSHTDRQKIYLQDTAAESFGWRYELLEAGTVREVQPQALSEWNICLPSEGAEAMRMSRTMTEQMPARPGETVWPILELHPYDTRVEVFLDGELLARDFEGAERDENGFCVMRPEELQSLRTEYRQMDVNLPLEYLGRELTIIVYYAQPRQDPMPIYPVLSTEEAEYASYVALSVPQIAILAVFAIITLLILTAFALDMRNGRPDWRMLLIALYFLLIFLESAYNSTAGTSSVFSQQLDLHFLAGLYMAPLYIYLALLFSDWKRAALSAATVVWALYEGTRMLLAQLRGETYVFLSGSGLGAYLLMIAFMAALLLECLFSKRRTNQRRVPRFYVPVALAVILARLLYGAREWEGNVLWYAHELIYAATSIFRPDNFNFEPVVCFTADVCSIMAVIVLMRSFVRRTIRTQETLDVLEQRSRLTLAGYERVLRAEEITGAVRHEMRHHMTALAGILQEGDAARAAEYIASVTHEMDRLPTMRYSVNLMVDIICGAYLDRAKAEGIRVEHSLAVPEKLAIADEDLSVFLSNLLENAVNACEKLPPERERVIRLKMRVHENSLFIGCTNSAGPEQGAKELDTEAWARRQHGYGLEAMRRIAEKYDSILVLERGEGTFSARSNLHLQGG